MKEAQKILNEQIVADSDELIPFQQGALRNSVTYPKGVYGDEIEYNTPYARYQYYGELYLTKSGSSFAQKGEKKYPTGEPLIQHHPGTTARWFDEAKRLHGKEWIDLVKETVTKE